MKNGSVVAFLAAPVTFTGTCLPRNETRVVRNLAVASHLDAGGIEEKEAFERWREGASRNAEAAAFLTVAVDLDDASSAAASGALTSTPTPGAAFPFLVLIAPAKMARELAL
jgi:hypothetical protein